MSGSGTTPLTLQRPLLDSPPSVVRAYITAILHERHGMPESAATRIAAAWSDGCRAELVSCDVETLRDLFGSEIGTLLFTHTREDLCQGEATAGRVKTKPRRTLFGVEPSFVLVESLFLITVLLAAIAYHKYDPVHGMAAVEMLKTKYFIAASGFVVLYVFHYFNVI